jgi:glycosyltransferase involved in cell wall biosynthesis
LLAPPVADFLVARFHWLYRLYLRSVTLQRLVAACVPVVERCLPRASYERRLESALRAALDHTRSVVQPVHRRIVLVNVGLEPGGAERQILYTLAGLKDSGFEDVTLLLTLPGEGGRAFHRAEATAAGLNVAHVGSLDSAEPPGDFESRAAEQAFLANLPVKLSASVATLRREFAARRPAVVHAWQDQTSIAAGFAAILAGVPRIVLGGRNINPQNFLYWRPYLRPCYRVLAKFASVHFTNNSAAGAADYARWLDLPATDFHVIRNGFDAGARLARPPAPDIATFRSRLGIDPDTPLVGSIFRLYPEKRPWLWMRMAAALSRRRPEVHFLLVGSGPMKGTVEALARRYGLESRFHLMPADAAIGLPLSAMDVLVLTSRAEGTPNVVIEAQCVGVPVVAVDAGGTAAAVQEGVTGWIDRTSRPERLAELVDRVLSNSAWRSEARRRGREFVAEQFSISRMITETLAIYGLSGRHDP